MVWLYREIMRAEAIYGEKSMHFQTSLSGNVTLKLIAVQSSRSFNGHSGIDQFRPDRVTSLEA